MNKIDINAPIIPDIGIGKINLLNNVFSLRKIVFDEIKHVIPNSSKFGEWTISYVFPDYLCFNYKGIIEIFSLIYTGTIISIKANEGYNGLLWGEIKCGSLVSDLKSLNKNLQFDEEFLFFKEYPSLLFTTGEDDFSSIDEVVESKITSIIIKSSKFHGKPLSEDSFPQEWKSLI